MKALTELSSRLITLNDGRQGLRGGLHCEVRSVIGADGKDPGAVLDFIATDETLDRYNEVIKLDGWDTKSYLANPVVPDCHCYYSIACILGRTIDLKIADGKMINRVEFALDNPLGSMAYKMAKGGFIKSESVGFIPREWTNGNKPGEPDRTYTEQELLEISLVVVPANPGATVGLALKSGAIERADIRDVIEVLKSFCSDKVDPPNTPRTEPGDQSAQLLQMARSLKSVLIK
jgi:HK97 family phage prohead protease